MTFDNRTMGCLFRREIADRLISCRISNVMFSNLQEILQSHHFKISQKFEMKGCQWHGVKRIKFTFADREIVE